MPQPIEQTSGAPQDVEKANRLLATLIDNLQVGVLMEDEHGYVMHINHTMCRMFGLPQLPSELKGTDVSGRILQVLNGSLPGPERVCTEESPEPEVPDAPLPVASREVRLADGRYLEQEYVPIFMGNAYRGQLWLYRDITAQKEAEEALRQNAAELKRNADELRYQEESIRALYTERVQRTEQLQAYAAQLQADATEIERTNQALAQARDEALQASRAKSEFLATMSHELRTPLNAIIGLTGLLLDTGLTARQSDYAETVRRSSESLLLIINDILDFSKIEAGRMELEEQPFTLQDCLDSSCNLLLPSAAAKELVLTYQIAPHTPRHWIGDATRLRQMLVNLLSNAVKFTEHGQVAVRVETRALDEAVMQDRPVETNGSIGHELHFTVADSGIGMTPEEISRLFVPFSQVNASTSRRYGGTGLGLVITHRLAQMMGGRIWVESERGQGSVFHFTVQLKMAPEAPQRLDGDSVWHHGRGVPQVAGLAPPQLGTLYPLRILLAEDSPVNQKVALYLLESLGYSADVAESGRQVLEVLERERYDVILMDIQMPGMDGIETASRIRDRYPSAVRPRIVAMTAHALRGDRERFLAAGMDDYMAKPVRVTELANVLRAVARAIAGQSQAARMTAVPAAVDTGGAGNKVFGGTAPPQPAPKQEAPDAPTPALDPEAVARLQDILGQGQAETIAEIGSILLSFAPPVLAGMWQALEQQDGEQLARSAHALRSSSANAAAVRLAQLCGELEGLGRSGQLGSAEGKLFEVEAEFGRVKEAVGGAVAEAGSKDRSRPMG